MDLLEDQTELSAGVYFFTAAELTDVVIDMPMEQEVVVKIHNGREYPHKLFGGRLDIPFVKEQLAQDGLRLSKLNVELPYCDGNRLSRAVFTTAMIKAETSRLKGSRADLETGVTNVYQRLKRTRTPVQTIREDGKALLDASQLCGAELVHTLLGDMPDAQALEAAAQSMKQQLEDCPCDGTSEGPVQKLVIRLFQDLCSGFSVPDSAAMLVWDTYLQGVTVSDSSIRAKPDMLLCDTYTEPAHVVSVVEAMSNLSEANNRIGVAYQLSQRVEHLQFSQTNRHAWVLAAVGSTSIEIWHTKQGGPNRRSGTLGLSPDIASPGLQALVRLYYSSPQRLGYICPALPNSFQLVDGCTVVPKGRLVPLAPISSISLRAADVYRGAIEQRAVIIKTSSHMTEEIAHHQWVKEHGSHLSHLPELLGTAQNGDRSWLVTPYYGPSLASLRSPTMIVDATLQAAHAIHFLAEKGQIHGDVSPYNICYQDGTATLVDLATLRSVDQVQLQASGVTGTPAFMSLTVLNGQIQSKSSELESLFYSMLYAATKGSLHWGGYLHTDAAALDAKLATMVVDDMFESKVVSCIDDRLLQIVARCVRALFFQNGKCLQGVEFKQFTAAVNQGRQ